MMKIPGILKYMAINFGPLITFYVIDHFFSLRFALACSILVTVAEILNIKLRKKEKLSGFFKFSAIVTILFGVLDIYLDKAIFIKFEAALMNFIFGVYFASTIFSQSPIMIEFARKSGKFDREITPEFISFFRYLTAVWVCYFLAKTGFYFWRADQDSSLTDMLLIRFTIGNGSLMAMIFLSSVGSRPLFKVLHRLGLLGH